jgi:hypothetical protein
VGRAAWVLVFVGAIGVIMDRSGHRSMQDGIDRGLVSEDVARNDRRQAGLLRKVTDPILYLGLTLLAIVFILSATGTAQWW